MTTDQPVSSTVESGPDQPALAAEHVSRDFQVRLSDGRRMTARVVDDVSVALYPGRILGLVGESGSGKTTLARLLGLVIQPTEGRIMLGGHPIGVKHLTRTTRGRVQLMFQDPFGSLNRLHRLRYILGRPLRLHGRARTRAEVAAGVAELLESVGLTPAGEFADRHPDELSGGQRQRVVIARSLAPQPSVILADEPVSMLDVSIRREILDLISRLRERRVAVLYVTHDIASARYLCDTIAVMYAGQIVETGSTEDVIDRPSHPYTQLLVDTTPQPAPPGNRRAGRERTAVVSVGEPPSPAEPPSGCRFHDRCPLATKVCITSRPPLETTGGHGVACWHSGR